MSKYMHSLEVTVLVLVSMFAFIVVGALIGGVAALWIEGIAWRDITGIASVGVLASFWLSTLAGYLFGSLGGSDPVIKLPIFQVKWWED